MGMGGFVWGITLPLALVIAVQFGNLPGALAFGSTLALFTALTLALSRRRSG
jgi:hypothetical protein